MMPQDPSTRDVLDRVLWIARQITWSDSSAIFLLESHGKLQAEVFRSVHRAELVRDSSLGIPEPLLHRALDSQESCFFGAEDHSEYRIFYDEDTAIAVPIQEMGVLYLGRRTSERFTDEEVAALVALAQQAYFALQVARLSVSALAFKREQEQARIGAEALLNSVSQILDLMTELMALTTPEEVLRTTGDNLYRVANFSFWAVIAGEIKDGEPQYFFTGQQQITEIDREATLGLALKGIESGRTLSLVKMERLSLPRPAADIRSVLICPMRADNQVIGCLMMCSTRPYFSRRERELLSTLALQVGSHFWNLHLHQSLVKAHDSLKLSQAQLVQSSKMAAVGQLAAGVAHELNTPLGAVNLAIEGALRCLDSKPDRAVQRLERALNAGSQLKEIIRKLLYYSKQSSSEGMPTRLNQVANDAVELIRHQLSLDGVQVELDLGEPPEVEANHNELQQVVINLLTNARDAVRELPSAERVVALSTRFEEGKSILTVSDPGSGMDEQTMTRVFDPFFTTKEVGKGTGLGLSVSKELVEKYHGDISIRSAPGQGTAITLSFTPIEE